MQLQVGAKEREIVRYASEKNALIDEKAIGLLKERPDFHEIIDQLLAENIFFINQKEVEKRLLRTKLPEGGTKPVEVHGKAFKPLAREREGRLRILSKSDVTGQSKSEGKTKDFLLYFRRKFELLSAMLKRRQGLSPRPISRLRLIAKGRNVDVIGMVFRKWVTKNGNIALHLEDLEANCIAIIAKDDTALTGLAEMVTVDSVIGVKAVKWNENMLIVKQV
ncbi:MAG: hypothetical protein KAX80_16255, partial [Planctomycetes bacterium]|nr:hypothetical protein [Planctomycetota bacterium]